MFLHSLFLGFSLATSGGIKHDFTPTQLFSTTSTLVAQAPRKRPAPPRRLPPNRVKPGGGLDTTKQSCRNSGQALTALVPVENPVLTASAHPTLLFYVADTATDVREGTFSIFTEDEKTRIYETRFTLPQSPGIVSIQLPQSADYQLKEGQPYHWYFKLYCRETNRAGADLYVNGWIQRVALTPERQQAIKAIVPGIWYDTLANLAQRLKATPGDPTLQQQWSSLLESIDLKHLANQPFVQLSPKEARQP